MTRATFLFAGGQVAVALLRGRRSWAAAVQAAPIVRVVRDVEIDWSAGLVSARGGAAADLRMPSAEVARAGAVRRAREGALTKLRAALVEVPLGKGRTWSARAVEAALGRARTFGLEPQSNGGVLLRVGIDFADLVGLPEPDADEEDAGAPPAAASASPSDLVVQVASAALEVRPRILIGERERAVGYAVYRLGPAPMGALEARRDRAGRLVLPKGAVAGEGRRLEQTRAVIHLDKIAR